MKKYITPTATSIDLFSEGDVMNLGINSKEGDADGKTNHKNKENPWGSFNWDATEDEEEEGF